MDIKGTLIKSFIPLIKDNLGGIERTISDRIDTVRLEETEQYAGYVLTNVGTATQPKLMLTLGAFSSDNKFLRSVETKEAKIFIEDLLQKV